VNLNNKVALITGAGSGIGRSAAIHLLNDGYSVTLSGRRLEPLEETARLSKASEEKICIVPSDVSDVKSIGKLFNKAKDKFGRLDILFNNAGIGAPPLVELEDLSLEDWKKVVDVNLTGSFLCAQHAINIMKSQSPMGGRIINNGSISAYVPRPYSVAYTATKHAVLGLTKSISLDCRKYNIACSQIDIGNASTPLTKRMEEGILQSNGTKMVEPTFNVDHAGSTILHMSNLPLDTNIQTVTIMATNMPYIGRG
jgi:NAD(P)-dependent dehydrogenase (short-subunit alcohol dehydrogenase family)